MNLSNCSLSLFLSIFISTISYAGPVPIVTSISPQSGPVGTSVTITGNNFNPVYSDNIVYFGATQATVTAATNNTITVLSPSGASFQPITVLDVASGLIGYSFKPFITTNATTAFTFKNKVDSVTGINPKLIAAGDFDRDGKPDLAVINSTGNSISIFGNACNSGTINLMTPIFLTTDINPSGIVIGDLDGDGKLDIAVVNYGANTVWVYRNISSGSGIISFATPIILSTIPNTKSIVIADINGDGKADITTASDGSNSIDVFKNTSVVGSLSFAVKLNLGIGGPSQSITAADINGDGKPEIIAAIGNGITILINNSTVTNINFSGTISKATGTTAQQIATGDIDGDGKIDVVISNSGSNNIALFINTGTVTSISFAAIKVFTVGTAPVGIAINDVNGDGLPDIITANSSSNNTSVLISTSAIGAPSFNASKNQICGTSPLGLIVLDLDGDGRPDIATANSTDNSLSALLNTFYVLAADALSFSTVKTTSGVQINWKSFAELSSKYFYIEKCSDGINFKTIDSVVNTSFPGHINDFSYTDKRPSDGFNYYRLTMIDIDGNFKYSIISVINWKNISSVYLNISPMPVKDFATVKFSENIGKSLFNIYDANARMVKSYVITPGATNLKLDRNNLSAGIYFYTFIDSKGMVKDKGQIMTQ